MEKIIEYQLLENLYTNNKLFLLVPTIEQIANTIIKCYKSGGKVLVFGNGGSAADAQHFVAEMIGKSAIALTTNTSTITAIGNDYGFDKIFSQQVEDLATKKDVVIGISTSGNSQNVINGILKAKSMKIKTIVLTGESGKLDGVADITLNVPSNNTPRIQEIHILVIHILSNLVQRVFSKQAKIKYKYGPETEMTISYYQ